MVREGRRKGDARAMLNSACFTTMVGRGADYAKAREWYEKAALRVAQYERHDILDSFMEEVRVFEDYTKDNPECYEEAADKGDASAKARLEKVAIREAAEARRSAEALQLKAWAAKMEVVETKREGKPGRGEGGRAYQRGMSPCSRENSPKRGPSPIVPTCSFRTTLRPQRQEARATSRSYLVDREECF